MPDQPNKPNRHQIASDRSDPKYRGIQSGVSQDSALADAKKVAEQVRAEEASGAVESYDERKARKADERLEKPAKAKAKPAKKK